jgi:aspartate racemase
MALAAARKTKELAEYLSSLLHQLAGGGAQVTTIPAFSPQICAQELIEITPIPLIDLLDPIVGIEAVRQTTEQGGHHAEVARDRPGE